MLPLDYTPRSFHSRLRQERYIMMIFLFAGIEDKMVVRLMCNEPVRRAVGRRELYENTECPWIKHAHYLIQRRHK